MRKPFSELHVIISPISSRAIRFSTLTVAGLSSLVCALPASAQDATSREVVQPLPSPEVQRLNRALLELARRPNRVGSMLEAADASMAVGDLDAAIGFYGRAADLAPNDPRVKLGLGRVYLRSGRPVDAIPLLNGALISGANPRDVLSDQALAFDLVGDQSSAQAAYTRAIELNPQDDEARRRLALSNAISGNEGGFQSALAPLLEARDPAAFRTRAFGLAILGQQDRAVGIVNEVMPRDLATRINPYLAFMPRLTSAQQAAAANLGIFPAAADIGREDPRIARFTSEGAVGALLEPAGEPLGSPAQSDTAPQVATVSQEVAQVAEAAPPATPPAATPIPAQADAAPVVAAASGAVESVAGTAPRPGFDLARSDQATAVSASQTLPTIATAETGAATPSSVPTVQPTTPPSSVADAFADIGSGELPSTAPSASSGAVDLAAIEIPREVAPEPDPEPVVPDHPRRIWVQLATGRDVAALKFDWRRFARRAPDLLGDFDPHVTPWGQANRLLAGPIDSREDARALINALSEKGLETFSYTSPEGTEIQELN